MVTRILAGLTLMILGAPAAAQTVVQLPTLHTFSIRTSVLVPDSGGAYLGGTNRSSSFRNSRGTPGWSPLDRTTSRSGAVIGSGVMVTATIIDHAELDAMVLDEAGAIREAKGIALPAPSRPRITAPRESEAPQSVAEIKRQLSAEDAEREQEAERDFAKAVAYEREGALSLARSYYRVAARKSTGPIRQKAAERLSALPKPSSSKDR
jgi:hypothetical protein